MKKIFFIFLITFGLLSYFHAVKASYVWGYGYCNERLISGTTWYCPAPGNGIPPWPATDNWQFTGSATGGPVFCNSGTKAGSVNGIKSGGLVGFYCTPVDTDGSNYTIVGTGSCPEYYHPAAGGGTSSWYCDPNSWSFSGAAGGGPTCTNSHVGDTAYSAYSAKLLSFKCRSKNCTYPWGGTMNGGSSVTAYSASSVACGSTCASVSQTRTCNEGVLSGSYTNSSCSVGACSCNLPWGGTIGNGSSVTAYSATSVACGSTCSSVSETRTCNNGTLSGSFTNQSCTLGSTFLDIGLKVQDSGITTSIAIETTCDVSKPLRIFKNGTIYCIALVDAGDLYATNVKIKTSSGIKFLRKTGGTGACACNLPWGGTLASGNSVTAYSASSVACDSSCSSVSQTRTCTNGILSGTYTNQNCSINIPVGYTYVATRSRCEAAPTCSSGTYNPTTNKCESGGVTTYAASFGGSGVSGPIEISGTTIRAYTGPWISMSSPSATSESSYNRVEVSNGNIRLWKQCAGTNASWIWYYSSPWIPIASAGSYISDKTFDCRVGIMFPINMQIRFGVETNNFKIRTYGWSNLIGGAITYTPWISLGYICDSGDTLSGTTCTHSTLTQVAPTCSSGGTLDPIYDVCRYP